MPDTFHYAVDIHCARRRINICNPLIIRRYVPANSWLALCATPEGCCQMVGSKYPRMDKGSLNGHRRVTKCPSPPTPHRSPLIAAQYRSACQHLTASDAGSAWGGGGRWDSYCKSFRQGSTREWSAPAGSDSACSRRSRTPSSTPTGGGSQGLG